MREGVQLVWLVWVADQSEAGFAEAQLATYGTRPFGDTGSCENITSTLSHSVQQVARVGRVLGVGGGWAWLGGVGRRSVVSSVCTFGACVPSTVRI